MQMNPLQYNWKISPTEDLQTFFSAGHKKKYPKPWLFIKWRSAWYEIHGTDSGVGKSHTGAANKN